jgi:hypothetical protein
MRWPWTFRRWRVVTCHPGSIVKPQVLCGPTRSRAKIERALAESNLPYIPNWRDRYSHYDWEIIPLHVTVERASGGVVG